VAAGPPEGAHGGQRGTLLAVADEDAVHVRVPLLTAQSWRDDGTHERVLPRPGAVGNVRVP
jgi:hypothetical protein